MIHCCKTAEESPALDVPIKTRLARRLPVEVPEYDGPRLRQFLCELLRSTNRVSLIVGSVYLGSVHNSTFRLNANARAAS